MNVRNIITNANSCLIFITMEANFRIIAELNRQINNRCLVLRQLLGNIKTCVSFQSRKQKERPLCFLSGVRYM